MTASPNVRCPDGEDWLEDEWRDRLEVEADARPGVLLESWSGCENEVWVVEGEEKITAAAAVIGLVFASMHRGNVPGRGLRKGAMAGACAAAHQCWCYLCSRCSMELRRRGVMVRQDDGTEQWARYGVQGPWQAGCSIIGDSEDLNCPNELRVDISPQQPAFWPSPRSPPPPVSQTIPPWNVPEPTNPRGVRGRMIAIVQPEVSLSGSVEGAR